MAKAIAKNSKIAKLALSLGTEFFYHDLQGNYDGDFHSYGTTVEHAQSMINEYKGYVFEDKDGLWVCGSCGYVGLIRFKAPSVAQLKAILEAEAEAAKIARACKKVTVAKKQVCRL
jgi:hypothetical protein